MLEWPHSKPSILQRALLDLCCNFFIRPEIENIFHFIEARHLKHTDFLFRICTEMHSYSQKSTCEFSARDFLAALMTSPISSGSQADNMKGWLSRSSADPRCSTSMSRQIETTFQIRGSE